MEKIKTSTFEYAKYDGDDPFDCAQEIIDNYEHYVGKNIWISDVYDSIRPSWLSDYGKEVFACFKLIVEHGNIATNTGAPKTAYDRLQRFITWANKYNIDTTYALKNKEEYEKNNPEQLQ